MLLSTVCSKLYLFLRVTDGAWNLLSQLMNQLIIHKVHHNITVLSQSQAASLNTRDKFLAAVLKKTITIIKSRVESKHSKVAEGFIFTQNY